MSTATYPTSSPLPGRPRALLGGVVLAAAAAATVAGLSGPVQAPGGPLAAAAGAAPAALSQPLDGATSRGAGPAVVPNAGQRRPAVRYEARAGSAALFFTPREVVLAGPRETVRLRFVGASPAPALDAVGRRPGVVNLLRGDSTRWRTGLPTYGGVRYRRLYPGVDARHDTAAAAGGPWVRSTFAVAPGADPAMIRWRYAGLETPRAGDGGLRVASRTGGPGLALTAPVAWQVVEGARHAVDAAYRVTGDGSVGVVLGRYDRTQPLLIGAAPGARATTGTPPALRYSSFFGGTNWDELYDVDVDGAGNAYVTGFTMSADFPVAGAAQPQQAGVMDAVVARVAPDGRLVYSTYLGGDATDSGQNVAVDKAGNAYVTGRTESEDFPTRSPLQAPVNGRRCQGEPCQDAFVTKLDPRGQLVYSTYLGGTGNEEGWGIALDADGRAHVAGNTDSDDFPTRNAIQPVNRSRGCEGDVPCPFETFVAKLNRAGSALHFATYLGGRASDLSGGIAVDGAGDIHVSGTTRSPDFPTHRALQPQLAGLGCGPPPGVPCTDVFVTKLDRTGTAFRYSTYLGGTEPDRSGGVAADRQGRSHLTGSTQSPDFPTAHAVQPALDNRSCGTEEPLELCDDAFVAALRPDGQALTFSTYLGGNAEDQGLGVAVDAKGAVHVAGSTDSRRFRTHAPLQAALGGAIDAFVARFAPGGRKLVFSTYLGGRDDERLNGIAAGRDGVSLLAGRTTSSGFPTANPFQAALGGDIDGVVLALRGRSD
jgi:hypothetical protein